MATDDPSTAPPEGSDETSTDQACPLAEADDKFDEAHYFIE
jgi:hypothetical protein